MLVSVVIPCYRSAATLEAVTAEIKRAVLAREGCDYQIVLVNDGSPDDTFGIIRALCSADSRITGISHSRNYGQETAIVTGLRYARGDAVVVMDDDGQHPAGELYKLVDKLSEGFDLVYAEFKHKQHSLFKRITSSLHGKISEFIGTKPKGIALSSFFAMSRFCAGELAKYRSPFTSRGGYLMHVTQRFANVEISEHRERMAGSSGYNLKRLFSLWFSNFTNFSIVPIRVASGIGGVTALAGFLFGLALIIRKLVNPLVALGYTSLMAVILFVGGVIIMMIGFVGEYVGRTYMTVSNMPQSIVRDEINAE